MELPDKCWSWKWVTGDTQICEGPCYLKKAKLTPDGSNSASATVIDGVDSGGITVIVLRCGATGTDNVNWREAAFLKQGLFIDCGTNLDGVFVQYYKE